MDESQPPVRVSDPSVVGPLTRAEAVALLDRAAELLASGDYKDAGERYARVAVIAGSSNPTTRA